VSNRAQQAADAIAELETPTPSEVYKATHEYDARSVAAAAAAAAADGESPGGSLPGAIQVAELTFEQVAGGGHTYTATFDLPTDSRLLKADLEILAGWDDDDDLPWVIGDESAPDNIFQASAGISTDGVYSSVYGGAAPEGWSLGGFHPADLGTLGAAAYPGGQTITAVCGPDILGGTGAAVVRLYYAVGPESVAAVVTP